MKNTILTEQDSFGEVLEIGIDHPFLSEFKLMLNNAIRDAVCYVSKDTTASISAKIEVNESWKANAEEESKLIEPVEFTIGLTTKRDFEKRKGASEGFMTKMIDGHLFLIELPDPQIGIEELPAVIDELEDVEPEGEPEYIFCPETDIGEEQATAEEVGMDPEIPEFFK